MGVEWVCFGRGHFVPEILQKKLAPMFNISGVHIHQASVHDNLLLIATDKSGM